MADFNDPHQPDLIAEPRAEYHAHETQVDREAYRNRLKLLLQDPEFRKIEGFPIGTDEAILQLSDPPYYTACPNPFMGEILEEWIEERRQTRKSLGLPDDERQPQLMDTRQPFAADVSEGKNDPIYNAHSYHTKVPHKAIMRYILHYTDPGDIVFDGFCGTGMTGVAAQLCGDKKTVESLGYQVRGDKIVDAQGKPISRLGARKSVLVDLSPAATFIAYNYNTPVDTRAFEREAKRILKEVEKECGWMYETTHTDGTTKCKINFIVWSDVFSCSQCGGEFVFWDVAIDEAHKAFKEQWACPICSTLLAKNPPKDSGAQKAEHSFETVYDHIIGQAIRVIKRVPVKINYSLGKKRFEKSPDNEDLLKISLIDQTEIPYPFPTNELNEGDKFSDPKNVGISHIHLFYTHRNLMVLSLLYEKICSTKDNRLIFWFTSTLPWCSRENRLHLGNYFEKKGGVITSLRGTWYIASLSVETNVLERFRLRLTSSSYSEPIKLGKSILSIQSATQLNLIPDSIFDYIFIDPPFGSNLMYSELNVVWESWLSILTNNKPEAIINKSQRKKLSDYLELMVSCYKEFFRVLKHGKWITTEFHNSQNIVWNSIQEALIQAGFMVADVRSIDKQKGSFNQVNSVGAVKQDLIISAYKPNEKFEKEFRREGGSVQGAWDFVRQHLENLPMPALKDGVIEPIQERLPYLLYDRMVAFHIQRGINVPLSAPEFYQGLPQRFLEREGMIFNPIQAAIYDKLRLQADRVAQLALFITDESSARQWIRQELEPTSGHGPQTYGELQPRFVQHLHQSKYEVLPELKVLLEQSFLQDEAGRWYNPDPDRQADLEALRLRALLHEFNDYRRSKGRLKVFRSEAIRAGFSQAWRERQYDIIVEIAERMPEAVLQEDQQLLMYYHNASLRQSKKPKQESLL
ncbi:MAG: site-specific DNA-methyltransferase [Chloroflexi bacterium]|jgi:DNA modification methylase|nr:site-specific DNA-methyltransferase [Chloroflexota bacterium]